MVRLPSDGILRRKRHGSRSGECTSELGEDRQIGEQPIVARIVAQGRFA
jgi:hypothetical protein